jgi:hypothetical protein
MACIGLLWKNGPENLVSETAEMVSYTIKDMPG